MQIASIELPAHDFFHTLEGAASMWGDVNLYYNARVIFFNFVHACKLGTSKHMFFFRACGAIRVAVCTSYLCGVTTFCGVTVDDPAETQDGCGS